MKINKRFLSSALLGVLIATLAAGCAPKKDDRDLSTDQLTAPKSSEPAASGSKSTTSDVPSIDQQAAELEKKAAADQAAIEKSSQGKKSGEVVLSEQKQTSVASTTKSESDRDDQSKMMSQSEAISFLWNMRAHSKLEFNALGSFGHGVATETGSKTIESFGSNRADACMLSIGKDISDDKNIFLGQQIDWENGAVAFDNLIGTSGAWLGYERKIVGFTAARNLTKHTLVMRYEYREGALSDRGNLDSYYLPSNFEIFLQLSNDDSKVSMFRITEKTGKIFGNSHNGFKIPRENIGFFRSIQCDGSAKSN